MKILMLVNWKINYLDSEDELIQSPDKVVKGEPYWFFKYFKEKHEVDVVGIKTTPDWIYDFEKNKLHFYLRQPFSMWGKSEKYDLIISHGSQSSLFLSILRRIKSNKNTRHLLIDVGCMNGGRESGLSLKLVKLAGHKLDGIIYHASIQKGYYERYLSWLKEKSFFIPFGTETGYYFPNSKIKEEPFVLAYGAIKRDYETLIKAAKSLPQIQFKIIGLIDLPFEVPPNVELIPFMAVDKLRDYIWRSRLVVIPLPVFNYAYGQMTLLQSMACKKAVVVTKTPSTIDYIEDNKTGIFVKPYDVSDMKEKIERVWNDEKLRKMLALSGSESVKAQFNEELMGLKVEEVIEKIMK
ncbi:hypothetical protein A2X44_04915 [candidate division CPR3 bacterium GWF2_35_18]|uniref:Glycosyl transferase family 1 domain-containing protein n=1 Tax=candidate division CPR3 bacterium GW2011_GWF2_35_18 TaxID=1618350 RepID=A0A0G0C0Y3_UNCC3|nr:MAG: hypothetical protein UR67_C0003G0064 [candidate division CPR3 bacterium GW2011_GWF2_35_18]OGB63675.1 MAG: hypothetical protein A2X44_04915 [candidate division CPR3 bacterium GWF2_35_18]OGB65004.1 MAG: hypothetical protein A2250_01125 [candidate division CPR3 bacterium RIFOXYA2_FULL_35_13]OGB79120.1 MAG: hypothetical protein A2296_04410 [candidate division CPR3 bacterium RIFOXYB2_FULL_35_8]